MDHSSEHYLDALLDAAVDGIIIIDAKGLIARINEAASGMFGYSPDRLIGKNVSMLMPANIADAHNGFIRRYQETGKAGIIGVGREVLCRHCDGHEFPGHLSVGEVTGMGEPLYVGIMRDLSQEYAARDEINILEKQLRDAARLVTLGEMTAGIAHEINQPLTAIAAFADAGVQQLKNRRGDQNDPDPLEAVCEKIAQQSHRAADIVLKLRNLVRPSLSDKRSFNLNKILKDILLLIEYNKNNNKITLQIDYSDDPLEGFGDPVLIQQIMLNLINNAIEAFPPLEPGAPVDERIIRVTTRRMGTLLIFRVLDNGPGVLPEAREQLFKPFYTTKKNGIGLGLSLSSTIARHHGGKLSYVPHDSAQDGFGAFELVLPQAQVG